MKNLLTHAVAIAFALTTLASCNKDEDKVSVAPSNPLTLTSSANNLVLTQLNDPNTAATFNWNTTKFALSGTPYTTAPVVTYQVQVAKSADGFGYVSASNFDAAANTTRAVTVEELNNALNAIGFPTGTPTTAYVRVAAVVGADNHTFASAPVPITVTAYPACLPPNTDTWGLVGPAGNGWPPNLPDPQNDLTMKWNCSLQAYTLRTTLNAGEFKFRQNKKWDVNLGGPSGNLAQGVALSPNGSNLSIATTGTYTVKLVVNGSGTGVTGGTVTVTP